MSRHTFDGKVALVTGAGSGLGHDYAVALARRGCRVMVQDLRDHHGETPEERTAQEVAEALNREGFADVAHDQGDVGIETYCTALVERTVARFGRIDILINNAGIAAGGSAQDCTTERMMQVLHINLLSAFWTMRAALRHMRAQNYGRIVNTASGTAVFGSAGMAPYVAAKGGLLALSKSAALDNVDRDIRINALCPLAATVMSRGYWARRSHVDLSLLSPAYVTPVVLYLSHEDCAFTGETLSAGSGKWSRIFTGKTHGADRVTTDVADAFAAIPEIMDTSRFEVLASAQSQYGG